MVHFDFHDRVIVVHAVFASIAIIGTAPAAILLARYGRHNPRWFAYHRLLNIATVLLIILTFGLGTAAVNSQGAGTEFGPQHDLHHDLGLSMLLLVFLEGLLGVLAHSVSTFRTVLGKSIVRWVHIMFGIIVMGLLITEAWVGFGEWNTVQSTGTYTPDGVRYVFVLISSAEVAAYLYSVGQEVLFKTIGDDGRGPWHLLEGGEKAMSVSGGQC
ncbi:hypothetical protein EI94DRAFT_1073711 [Lactarius quietus]|nr:hypothetical protein EI94DRAFT_1073711 [Lactarius quietus]